MEWTPLPLNQPMFRNLSEAAVMTYQAAVENGFINDLGGHTRFPGLREVCTLPDNGRVYLHDFRSNLIAATSKGGVYEIDRNYNVTNLTEVPVSGGRRVIFAKTNTDLLMAAGGPIVQVRAGLTELLSEDAPLASYVQWIDGYTLAAEVNSGRFYHSAPGDPKSWDPLDTFNADGNPDNISNLIVTPFREVMIGGSDSIEQFQRVESGDPPFYRRWSVGDGVALPYAMLFADNAIWTLNNLYEFIRSSGQISETKSGEIGKLIEAIDDWQDAWLGGFPDRPLHIVGQKFMILQAPQASNSYGTKGLTLLHDYKNGRWYELYGWNADDGLPDRWPGWSHWPLWQKVFVGGEGKIYELAPDVHNNGGERQRWLIRTGVLSQGEQMEISSLRVMLERGLGSNTMAGELQIRCSRDGRPFSPWIRRSLGLAGNRQFFIYFGSFGAAHTFQFEISCGDDYPINILKAEFVSEALGN